MTMNELINSTSATIVDVRGEGEFATFIMWTTPSEIAALIGMLIFISVFLCLTYFLYKRRQSKSE